MPSIARVKGWPRFFGWPFKQPDSSVTFPDGQQPTADGWYYQLEPNGAAVGPFDSFALAAQECARQHPGLFAQQPVSPLPPDPV